MQSFLKKIIGLHFFVQKVETPLEIVKVWMKGMNFHVKKMASYIVDI